MKVPIYEGMVRLPAEGPGAMGNLTAAALQGQAVAAAGNELLKITGEWNRSINQAQQLTDMANAHNDAREHLFNLKNDIRDNTDPDTWAPTFQGKAQEWFQERHDSLKDPAVQAQFKNWWGTQYYSVLQGITEKARTQKVLNFTGDIETNYGRSVDLYNQTEDDLEKARIKGDLHGMLDGGATAGLLPSAKAQQLKQGFETAVMNDRLMKDAVNDPAGLLARTKDTQEAERNYPGIDPKAVYTAHGHASAQIHKRQEANVLEVQKGLEAKSLTFDELTERRDSPDPNRTISLAHYRHYDAQLTNQMTPGKKEMDPEVYIRLFNDAGKGVLDQEDLYRAVKAGKLGEPTQAAHYYKELTGINEQRTPVAVDLAFLKDPYKKQVHSFIMHEIDKRISIFDKPFAERVTVMKGGLAAPKEPLPSYAASYAYLTACKEQAAKGEITGEWMINKAQEIMGFYETRNYRAGKPGGKPAPAPVPAPVQPAPASGPLFNPTKGPKQTQQEPW